MQGHDGFFFLNHKYQETTEPLERGLSLEQILENTEVIFLPILVYGAESLFQDICVCRVDQNV